MDMKMSKLYYLGQKVVWYAMKMTIFTNSNTISVQCIFLKCGSIVWFWPLNLLEVKAVIITDVTTKKYYSYRQYDITNLA